MPGAIELKRGVEGYAAAAPGTVLFGIDSDGNPVTIDDQGVVRSSASLDGSPLLLVEQLSAPTTGAGEMKVFAKREGGELAIYQRGESNGEVALVGGGALGINWKGGTPGNPYVDGDLAVALADQMVMVLAMDPEIVTIQFPSSNLANRGKRIIIVNLVDKKVDPGLWVLMPATGESISIGAVDQLVAPADESFSYSGTFVADGNGIWHPVAYGSSVIAVPFTP